MVNLLTVGLPSEFKCIAVRCMSMYNKLLSNHIIHFLIFIIVTDLIYISIIGCCHLTFKFSYGMTVGKGNPIWHV